MVSLASSIVRTLFLAVESYSGIMRPLRVCGGCARSRCTLTLIRWPAYPGFRGMEPFRVACATVLLGISLFYFFLLSICSLNPNGLLGILPLTKSLQRRFNHSTFWAPHTHAYFYGYIFESAMVDGLNAYSCQQSTNLCQLQELLGSLHIRRTRTLASANVVRRARAR